MSARIAVASALLVSAALAGCTDDAHTGGIPVLVFHEICAQACAPSATYGTTKAEFERTMRMIKGAGYETISMADFVRAHAGETRHLPAKPMLITFDDGRMDGYLGADEILQALGLQATMFVVTTEAETKQRFSMQWAQIQEAAASGRWDIQLHAHEGHVRVPVMVDSEGTPTLKPFYGWRKCVEASCASLETFDDWRVRAEKDIEAGDDLLTSKLGAGAYASLSFAVPFGDYGQKHSNDPGIARELRAFLDARFAVWFTQPSADPAFMLPSATNHEVARFLVLNTTTTEDVDAWLASHELHPR